MVRIDLSHAKATFDDTLLQEETTRIQGAQKEYSDLRSSVALVHDAELFHNTHALAQNYADTDLIVIIGIGGSNLGTQALLKALSTQKHVLFMDTVDPDDTANTLRILQDALLQNKRVLINIISKSGSTAETVANAKSALALLTEHNLSLAEHVVITTDKDSALDALAAEHDIPALYIPKQVGGRFSVFSPVGVFPLTVAGVDTQALLTGAKRALADALDGEGVAQQLALTQHHHATQGKNVVDFFVFAKRLDLVGAWYRQLLGESIGKNLDTGITPTTSVGSTDLHSVAQLYFAGPHDKFFLLTTLSERELVPAPESILDALALSLQGVSHNKLYDAIYQGTRQAFINQDIPFAEITLTHGSEEELGFLLQTLMLQVIYLGALFGVNAFDQPAVELYKKETRTVLSR